MKFKDIEITPEEVLQFLQEAGLDITEIDKIKFSDKPTLQEQVDWIEKRLVMLDDLYDIAVELDTRENSNDYLVDRLQSYSWQELCDKGIAILKELKKEKYI
jgi:hypothetical protein